MRQLSGDPAALLALAHPTRLALLELLAASGPLTATEAGQRLGESAGTMSWHLRLLARHGFVVEEPGLGRRRPWRLVAHGTRIDPEPSSAAERAAADAVYRTVLDRALGMLHAWLASRHAAPPEWRRSAALSDWTLYLTATEAAELRDALYAQFERYHDRLADPSSRPPDALPVHALFTLHPQSAPAGRAE